MDWTARELRAGKRGATPQSGTPILDRLGIHANVWFELTANLSVQACRKASASGPLTLRGRKTSHDRLCVSLLVAIGRYKVTVNFDNSKRAQNLIERRFGAGITMGRYMKESECHRIHWVEVQTHKSTIKIDRFAIATFATVPTVCYAMTYGPTLRLPAAPPKSNVHASFLTELKGGAKANVVVVGVRRNVETERRTAKVGCTPVTAPTKDAVRARFWSSRIQSTH